MKIWHFSFQWECVGQLNKLPVLEDLVITYDMKAFPYFQEFTFARIANLKVNTCHES